MKFLGCIIDFLLYTPILRVSVERYETDDVIVTVEWTPQEGVTYTTSISPLTSITITGNSSRQLIISYNTNYNFSVEAAPPCGPNPTAVIPLNYGKGCVLIIIVSEIIIMFYARFV